MPSLASPEEEEPQNWSLEPMEHPTDWQVVAVAAAVGPVRFRRTGCEVVSPQPIVVRVVVEAAVAEAAHSAAGEVAAAGGMRAVDCQYFQHEEEFRPRR